ncbi:MAG: RNA polymerase sigma-70 factor [Bacteroidota bacterium]
MKKALSDYELIQLLKDDDKAAFTEIYSRYIEGLAGFANSHLYDLDDTRDILHDIFAKLWEDRHDLEISGNLKSYLFSATRYSVIDRIRRKVIRRDYALKLSALQTFDDYGADKILEAKELQKKILALLEGLPARTKQIYQLSRDEQLSSMEIAQKLDISEQTVKNQLTIALKHLRRSIMGVYIIALLNCWF